MNEQQSAIVGTIEATFEGVIGAGLRRTAVSGATDAEIDGFAAEQGVTDVPVAVRAVLRLIGSESGLWWAGTHFGVKYIFGEHKQYAIDTLDTVEHELRCPEGLLVLSSHQSYEYVVIDGADLHLDDPPVWEVVEHEHAHRFWDRVSGWFAATAPDIDGYRDDAECYAEMGFEHPWRFDIDPDPRGS
ncbi:hypothetical protein ACFVUS_07075 [Nocardia sp. NPDC058058]|uniref:hypothetical protein n=1 Tax=Nocardia sp. NPDC058058 TaxID=3346317 RepID=UPI0036D91982